MVRKSSITLSQMIVLQNLFSKNYDKVFFQRILTNQVHNQQSKDTLHLISKAVKFAKILF